MVLQKAGGYFGGRRVKKNVLYYAVLPIAVKSDVNFFSVEYGLHSNRDAPLRHASEVSALISVGIYRLSFAGYG